MIRIIIGIYGIWIYIFTAEFVNGLPILPNANGFKSVHNDELSSYNDGMEHILSRHKRSSNETVDNRSAIEKFYADPNNKAMYLVLPLIVLVYGGCSSIYCIYKCRRYIKRQRTKRQLEKMKKSIPDIQQPMCSNDGEDSQGAFDRQITSASITRTASSATLLPNTIDDEAVVDKTKLYPKLDQSGVDKATPVVTLPLEDLEDKNEYQEENQKNVRKSKSAESSFIISQNGTPKSSRPVSKEYERSESKELDRQRALSRNDGSGELRKEKIRTDSRNSVISNGIDNRSYSKLSSHRTQSSFADVTERKLPKVAKFSDLTDSDIRTILNYYSEKKHMPDVIPEDEENMVPIRKSTKKWKYRVFNA